jgi:hypothetical protein
MPFDVAVMAPISPSDVHHCSLPRSMNFDVSETDALKYKSVFLAISDFTEPDRIQNKYSSELWELANALNGAGKNPLARQARLPNGNTEKVLRCSEKSVAHMKSVQ